MKVFMFPDPWTETTAYVLETIPYFCLKEQSLLNTHFVPQKIELKS